MKELTVLVTEIKAQVKSTHDIIPFKDAPFFYIDQKEEYEKKFGKEVVQRYIEATDLNNKVRDEVNAIIKSKRDPALFSSLVITNLTTALCGLGECGEQSTLGYCKLLEQNFPDKISWFVIQGKKGISYNHCIILISKKEVSFQSIQEFKSLDDSYILIDPLFGIVGKANEIHALLKDIIVEFGLEKINSGFTFTSSDNREQVLTFLAEAKQISEQVKEKLDLPKNIKKIYSPTSSMPQSELVQDIQKQLKEVTNLEWKYFAKQKTAICNDLDSKALDSLIKKFEFLKIQRKKNSHTGKAVAVIVLSDHKIPKSKPTVSTMMPELTPPQFSQVAKTEVLATATEETQALIALNLTSSTAPATSTSRKPDTDKTSLIKTKV